MEIFDTYLDKTLNNNLKLVESVKRSDEDWDIQLPMEYKVQWTVVEIDRQQYENKKMLLQKARQN